MFTKIMRYTLVCVLVLSLGVASQPQSQPRIVIVGAGLSGISAAHRLQRKGLTNFVILEATGRIGGRIQTEKFGDGWVDMGAEEIYGTMDNAAFTYASYHNLLDYEQSFASDEYFEEYRTNNGTELDGILMQDIIEFLEFKLVELLFEKDPYSDEDNQTLDALLEEALMQMNRDRSHNYPNDETFKNELLRWFQYQMCTYVGCNSLSEITLKSLAQNEAFEEDSSYILKGGMMSLVQSLSSIIPQQSIQLGKIVQKITVSTENEADTSKPPVTVSTSDGENYEADHVICTVPLGVLKEVAPAMFEPQLSPEKLEAIEKMGYGTVDHIFLAFERPFWPLKNYGYNLLWTANDSESNDAASWFRAIPMFFTVSSASNVLCGWITGDAARAMEALNDDEIQTATTDLLKRFTGINELPEVKAMTRSKWYSSPYARGSFSYLNRELPDRTKANEILAEPVYYDRGNNIQYPAVLFAGEATHPDYFATVQGAMQTGFREANRIRKFHSRRRQARSYLMQFKMQD